MRARGDGLVQYAKDWMKDFLQARSFLFLKASRLAMESTKPYLVAGGRSFPYSISVDA